MIWFLYLSAAVVCMSIGACLGLIVGASLALARRADEQEENFYSMIKERG